MNELRHSARCVKTFSSCTFYKPPSRHLLALADRRTLVHILRIFGFVGLNYIGGSVSQPAEFDIDRMFSC